MLKLILFERLITRSIVIQSKNLKNESPPVLASAESLLVPLLLQF